MQRPRPYRQLDREKIRLSASWPPRPRAQRMGPHVSGKEAERNRLQSPMRVQKPSAVALKYPAASAAFACSPNRLPCSALAAPLRSPPISNPLRPSTATTTTSPAMDLFPDGGFVRLESRELEGKFVHADEDWEGVSLRRDNGAVPALNTVWRVQHRAGDSDVVGDAFVLLQNAAFGRYLSYSTKKAQGGPRATQRNHSEPTAGFHIARPYPWMWTVQSALRSPDENYVTLGYIYMTCYLCANRKCKSLLSFSNPPFTTMMHWKVHLVEDSTVPPHIPLTLEHQGDNNAHVIRTIRHVRANDEGEFDQNHHNWASFAFVGTSVNELKDQLRLRQDWNEVMDTLCMRPGSQGRLVPLVTDELPRSLDSMNIVVLTTGSQGAAALRYPDDAEANF